MVKKSPPDEPEHGDLGAQLSAAAKKLGLTAYQLSIRSGVPAPSVRAALAGGNITLASLRLIARALGLRKLKMRDLEIEMSAGVIDPGVAASTLALLDEAVRTVTESRAAVAHLVDEAHARGEMSRLVDQVDINAPAKTHRGEPAETPKR